MTKTAANTRKITTAELSQEVERLETLCSDLRHEQKQIKREQQQFLEKLVCHLVANTAAEPAKAESLESGIDTRELTRALLLSRERVDAAINLAARRFLDVLSDIQELEKRRDSAESVEFAVRTLNRYLVYHQQDLLALDVSITPVATGTPFDASYHEVVGRHPTKRPDRVDTVATSLTPLMSWKDANGTPQMRPAKVIVYTAETSVSCAIEAKYVGA